MKYDVVIGEGLSKYVEGKVYILGKWFDVYICSSSSSFNGCKVLLNALMV